LIRQEAGTLTPAHELGYRHGGWDAVNCLLLRWASLQQSFVQAEIEAVWRGDAAKFPISAADLMPTFSGKALGDQIRKLEATWIASDFRMSKDDLLKLA